MYLWPTALCCADTATLGTGEEKKRESLPMASKDATHDCGRRAKVISVSMPDGKMMWESTAGKDRFKSGMASGAARKSQTGGVPKIAYRLVADKRSTWYECLVISLFTMGAKPFYPRLMGSIFVCVLADFGFDISVLSVYLSGNLRLQKWLVSHWRAVDNIPHSTVTCLPYLT